MSYTYRTVTSINGHLLQLRIDQPTNGLEIDLDYTDCNIDYVNVLDFMASSRPAQIIKSPSSVPEQTVSMKFDGWALPRSGVAFVWVTDAADEDEDEAAVLTSAATAP